MNLINVVSLRDDPGLEVYTKFSEVQLKRFYEPDGGLFIAESPKVALRALDAGCVPVSILVEDRHVEGEAAEVLSRCTELCGDIPVYVGRYEQLTGLTGYALTRGILCAMRRPPLRDAMELLRGGRPGLQGEDVGLQKEDIELQGEEIGLQGEEIGQPRIKTPQHPGCGAKNTVPPTGRYKSPVRRIAVLENVMNPANVGAIFRNAAALGMDAVLLTDGCSDPLYRRTLRVSMGTALQIPWVWVGESLSDWQDRGIQMLKREGFRTIAMALNEDAVEMNALRIGREEKAAVILGAEGDGLSPETIRQADDVVMIPMQRGVDSLNVAAASAIAFYCFGGQQQGQCF